MLPDWLAGITGGGVGMDYRSSSAPNQPTYGRPTCDSSASLARKNVDEISAASGEEGGGIVPSSTDETTGATRGWVIVPSCTFLHLHRHSARRSPARVQISRDYPCALGRQAGGRDRASVGVRTADEEGHALGDHRYGEGGSVGLVTALDHVERALRKLWEGREVYRVGDRVRGPPPARARQNGPEGTVHVHTSMKLSPSGAVDVTIGGESGPPRVLNVKSSMSSALTATAEPTIVSRSAISARVRRPSKFQFSSKFPF